MLLTSAAMNDDSVCLRTVSFHILLMRLWNRNIPHGVKTERERNREGAGARHKDLQGIVMYLSVSSSSATLAAGVAAVGPQGSTLHRVRRAGRGSGTAMRETQAPAIVLLTLPAIYKHICLVTNEDVKDRFLQLHNAP